MQSFYHSSYDRLTQLKEFVAENEDLKRTSTSLLISNAKSIGEIWYHLISNNFRYLLGNVLRAKLFPTADELNYIEKDCSVWFHLAEDYFCNELLNILLYNKILPSPAVLSQFRKKDNTNVWFWLSKHISTPYSPLFSLYLEANIFPDAESMSRCSRVDNTNGWYWLSYALPAGTRIFLKLMEKKILPSARDLAACSTRDRKNTWNVLANNDTNYRVFETLFKNNIIPTNNDLSECDRYNRNTWYLLAGRYPSIFLQLLDLHVIPSAEALSQFEKDNLTNTWSYLASSDTGIEVFKKLLGLDVVPNANELDILDKDGRSVWFWLSLRINGLSLFQELLKRHILPSSTALNNVWVELLNSQRGVEVFQSLLNLQILPTCEVSLLDNLWFKLLSNAHALIAAQLLARNILPTLESIDFFSRRREYLQIKKMKEINSTFHIQPRTEITFLLIEDNLQNCYSFLYFFYLVSTHKQFFYFPFEILNHIANYILPTSMRLENLDGENNRSAFIKFHTDRAITHYLEKNSFFKMRATSLNEEVKKSSKPDSLLITQSLMGRNPGKTPYQSHPNQAEYEKAFQTKLSDEPFNQILCDGYYLRY